MNRTAWCLLALLFCLSALVLLAGVTIWTVEHYMKITPADWPYPGSFWDRANDFACGLILFPAGSIGRFCAWLVLFPIPIVIELYRRRWQRAVLLLFSVMLPYSYADILFENRLSHDFSLASVLTLLLAFVAPPFLMASWSALVQNPAEKRLLRANLIVLWVTFCTADILLGLSVHANACKPAITRALIRLDP